MAKYIVRYGVMRALGVMAPRAKDTFDRGARVIVRTNRGLEVGDVLCEATEETVALLKDPFHQEKSSATEVRLPDLSLQDTRIPWYCQRQ